MSGILRRRALIVAAGTHPLTPSDYVQDGLTHMWDGEYNAGTTHSDAITSWKDLIGTADLTLSPDVIIGDKYMGNDSGTGYIARYSSRIGAYTIQFVFKRNDFNSSVTTFVLSNRLTDTRYSGNFFFNYGNLGYLYFESLGSLTNRRGVPIPTSDRSIHTISASWASGTAAASNGYDNMAYTMVSNLGGSGREGSTVFMVGNYAIGGNYGLLGNVYCIRLYNRVLTASEIIKNQQIDLQRFTS